MGRKRVIEDEKAAIIVEDEAVTVVKEEGEHNVETNVPKTVMEDEEAAIIVEDEAVTVVKEELDNTFVDVSDSVSKRVANALNETYESHAQLVNDFDAKIEALLGECDGTISVDTKMN